MLTSIIYALIGLSLIFVVLQFAAGFIVSLAPFVKFLMFLFFLVAVLYVVQPAAIR